MKNLLKILIPVVVCVIMAFKFTSIPLTIEQPQVSITKTPKVVPVKPVEVKIEVPEIKTYNHSDFLEAIGNYESGNRYHISNRFGYMGRYQFHRSTLKALGFNVTRKEFLNNPGLQEEAMDRLLTSNYRTLKKYIRKYEGEKRYGVLITKSGVLAAAHLGGAGNVSKWFRRGVNFEDGNGTKITTYMKVFNGYSLNL